MQITPKIEDDIWKGKCVYRTKNLGGTQPQSVVEIPDKGFVVILGFEYAPFTYFPDGEEALFDDFFNTLQKLSDFDSDTQFLQQVNFYNSSSSFNFVVKVEADVLVSGTIPDELGPNEISNRGALLTKTKCFNTYMVFKESFAVSVVECNERTIGQRIAPLQNFSPLQPNKVIAPSLFVPQAISEIQASSPANIYQPLSKSNSPNYVGVGAGVADQKELVINGKSKFAEVANLGVDEVPCTNPYTLQIHYVEYFDQPPSTLK